MIKKISRLLLNLFFLLLPMQTALALEVKATIDRNPVGINESFQLVYTASQSVDEDPDFAPLTNHFTLLSQNHRSQLSWVNGKSTQSIQWILNLKPNKVGNLSIPSISFGRDKSQAISILVTKNSVNHSQSNDIYFEVEVSNKKPYVQSQVIYTLRIFYKIKIYNSNLSALTLKDAIIEKLTDEKNYSRNINGMTYQVTELKYAIFPQKSGVMTIEPLILTVKVSGGGRANINSFFNSNTQTKHISSKAITLSVQAVPNKHKKKFWLPAEHLQLKEKWSGDFLNMKIGEPLTRTLTMIAKGTTVAQLPELYNQAENSHLKSYPDQAALEENKQATGLVAIRVEKTAYIPSKPGSYTLAAIEVPWFNTQTKKIEIARIPERTVTALASNQSVINNDDFESVASNNPLKQSVFSHTIDNKFWPLVSIILGFGWLMTLFFLLRKTQHKQKTKPVSSKEIKLKQAVKLLKQACLENNKIAAKDAILIWGKINYQSHNIFDIASHCESPLKDEIYLLNKNIYSAQTEPWQGEQLLKYFIANKTDKKTSKKTDGVLEVLHKIKEGSIT